MQKLSPALSTIPLLLVLVIFSTSSTISNAFSLLTPSISLPHQGSKSSTTLHVFFDNDNFQEDEDEGYFDLEEARERLEALVGDELESQQQMQTVERPTVRSPTYTQSAELPALDVILPPAPPMTTIERERREVEIQLLETLREGDDKISDLWTLWFGERGSDAAQKLAQAEEYTNEGPAKWKEAEDILQELIQEHGIYFVEPVNRLATLYYMQGHLDQAETLCKIVLAVKPWHFGALSGIVMIYAAQADSDKARLWAPSRLPTFAPTGANRRRISWAEKAVESAKESLANAEQRVQDLFGKPDDYTMEVDNSCDHDHDDWQ